MAYRLRELGQEHDIVQGLGPGPGFVTLETLIRAEVIALRAPPRVRIVNGLGLYAIHEVAVAHQGVAAPRSPADAGIERASGIDLRLDARVADRGQLRPRRVEPQGIEGVPDARGAARLVGARGVAGVAFAQVAERILGDG